MTLGDLIKACPRLLDIEVSGYNANTYSGPPVKGIQIVSESISIALTKVSEKAV